MSEKSIHTQQLHNWLQRMNEGDAQAEDEMLRSVGNRLEKLARRMLKDFPNVKRWSDTNDVLQNALMRLLHSLKKIKPNTMRAFYGLAAIEIRRELLDLARHYNGKQGTGANHHSVGGNKDISEVAWEPEDTNDNAAEMDKWYIFHREVEQLPTDLREVVSLVFYHGWTQAEVAELFQVDERTIRRRWREALLKLREAVKGELPAL